MKLFLLVVVVAGLGLVCGYLRAERMMWETLDGVDWDA